MIFSLLSGVFAQSRSKPARQEKLLNDLKVLMWNDAAANNISVKIRVHSGAAFDPQGREGVMSLLADNIFPNEATRDFFAEDLGGSLDVFVTQDFTEIDATAKPENLLPMLETLARAVSAPIIDKETTAKLKTARLEKLNSLEKDANYAADQIAHQRLFGTFPYGRAVLGTSESVKKIDFADLIFARQKFLTADNATLAVSGNFKTDLAYRAIRRYFGGWAKSDKKIPSNFRQPDAPDPSILVVQTAVDSPTFIRNITRGLARGDKNYPASEILMEVLRGRITSDAAFAPIKNLQIRQEAHILPGTVILSFDSQTAANAGSSSNLLQDLFSKTVTGDEFAKAKTRILSQIAAKNFDDNYLDADTFQFSAEDNLKSFQNVNLADVEAVRQKFAAQPIAAVKVSGAETPAVVKN